mmetsp:Transcript_12949/g.24667  ORF Transcript_12949/g.24667 Transcript_12949/m.24667 type:complete len:335 (-) Transcript_12949:666-1670(-)
MTTCQHLTTPLAKTPTKRSSCFRFSLQNPLCARKGSTSASDERAVKSEICRLEATRRDGLIASIAVSGTVPLGWLSNDLPFGNTAAFAQEVSLDVHLLEDFWAEILMQTRDVVGRGFNSELQFFDAETPRKFPPGNPAKDFGSEGVRGQYNGTGMCGVLDSFSDQPYAVCGAPGDVPTDDIARDCCRHTAYTYVPNQFYGMKSIPPVPVVVVSPRARLLDEAGWKAILAHEMGHCVDFYLFGKRYGLLNRTAADKNLYAALKEASSEPDPELRADDFANIILSSSIGGSVCYDPVTTLQTLVPNNEFPCKGTMNEGDTRPMLHYTHPPLEGKLR